MTTKIKFELWNNGKRIKAIDAWPDEIDKHLERDGDEVFPAGKSPYIEDTRDEKLDIVQIVPEKRKVF